MSKNTRSNISLPGNIREYILEEQSNNMPDQLVEGNGEAEALDIKSLLTMMTKTLTAVTESRQSGGNMNHTKLEDCPIKRSSSSLDAWISEVLLWDESNTGTDVGLKAKKYLKFVESIRKSEDSSDLQNMVQVEFVENESFDKKGDSVIKTIIEKIKEKLGQTDLEKCSDAWLEFINIKQEPEENAKSYLARFEKVESQLRNVKITIPNKALAIHLMNRSSMEEQSKENVLTKTVLDDENVIYSSMKKSIREMKGNMTVKEKKTDTKLSTAETNTYYGGYQERSRSQSKFNNRKQGDRSQSWRKDEEKKPSFYRKDRSKSRYKGRNSSRDTSRRGERDSYNKGNSYNKGDSYSGRNRDSYRSDRQTSGRRHDSRRRSHSNYRGHSTRRSSSDEVNVVHISNYLSKENYSYDTDVIRDILDNCDDIDRAIVEVIYNEGDSHIDPYKLVVDSGCPKTVTGRPWLDAFIESKGDNVKVRLGKENEKFRFGPSDVYTSKENYAIEVNIGNLKEMIKVSVVDANIPLLLGLDYQKKWGMIIDLGKDEIYIRKSKETFKIKPKTTHWTLPIQRKTLHRQARTLVYNVNLDGMMEHQLRKHIKKIHKNLSHKSEEQLLKLFRMAGKDTSEVKATIKNVVETCNICNRFRKTPPRSCNAKGIYHE